MVYVRYSVAAVDDDGYLRLYIGFHVDNGGSDDLERVISTKDSLQNHLSLATHINHTGGGSRRVGISARSYARYSEGVYTGRSTKR